MLLKNDESHCGYGHGPFLLVPKKSSVLSSMGLLIARGASPGNKSGIKRIFSIASKMASKGAAREIKRLERSLLGTFKPEPIFA